LASGSGLIGSATRFRRQRLEKNRFWPKPSRQQGIYGPDIGVDLIASRNRFDSDIGVGSDYTKREERKQIYKHNHPVVFRVVVHDEHMPWWMGLDSLEQCLIPNNSCRQFAREHSRRNEPLQIGKSSLDEGPAYPVGNEVERVLRGTTAGMGCAQHTRIELSGNLDYHPSIVFAQPLPNQIAVPTPKVRFDLEFLACLENPVLSLDATRRRVLGNLLRREEHLAVTGDYHGYGS
jgi:hypothetical protein